MSRQLSFWKTLNGFSLNTRLVIAGITTVLIVFSLLAGAALAAGETITRGAFSSTSGVVSNGSLQLIYSVGQPVAGPVSSGSDQDLCSGFLCGSPQSMGVSFLYLPLLTQ